MKSVSPRLSPRSQSHPPRTTLPTKPAEGIVPDRAGVIGLVNYLQQTVGNQAVARLIQRNAIGSVSQLLTPGRARLPASPAPTDRAPAPAEESSEEDREARENAMPVAPGPDFDGGRVVRLVQRQHHHAADAATITDAQAHSAVEWAARQKLGEEAIRELQTALEMPVSGVYDAATAAAVYLKQREWRPHGRISHPGRATEAVFERLGLIVTHQIQTATITDAILAQIVGNPRNANGVTVAIYANLKNQTANNREFANQAGIFARNQQTVGLDGGAVRLSVAIPITALGNILEAVQSIHRGLVAKFNASQPATQPPPDPPPWTRIANLALFSHGMGYGMGLNAKNAFSHGGLHSNGSELNPPNVKAFVRGLSGAIAPDVRVQLFACSTAHDPGATGEWGEPGQGERTGSHSFAAALSDELGPDASVYGHSTAGHTTENFAAKVFGHDAGGGAGGLHMFDLMYPEAFIQSELTRLFPGDSPEGLAAMHDSMRDQMWRHYKDSITGEHHRTGRNKRYPVPMGQEMFVNATHARELFHADWTTFWAPHHQDAIHPPRPRGRGHRRH